MLQFCPLVGKEFQHASQNNNFLTHQYFHLYSYYVLYNMYYIICAHSVVHIHREITVDMMPLWM